MNHSTTDVSHSSTVLAVWIRPLADYLERNGFDGQAVFERAGIDYNSLFAPSVRLPLKLAANMWREVADLTGKPFIGLEVFRQASSLQADTMAVAMMASRNFYEALQCMTRLSHIICDAVDISIERDGSDLHIRFIVRPEDRDIMPLEAMDPAFLIVLNLVWQGLVEVDCIKILCFQREQPSAEMVTHLEALLGVPTQFNCEHYSMTIDWQKSQHINPYWNPALAQMSEALALKDLQQLSEENVIARVRKLVMEQLPLGTPQQDDIATMLNINTRQLQRKLSTHGTSFSELLQQIRLTLAHQYLCDPCMAMVDIAFALGFQDQSNFVKAFKKWCGETPGQYRKRVQV